MMMKRIIQEGGGLFDLAPSTTNNSRQSHEQLEEFENNYTQQDLQIIRQRQKQKQIIQMKQNLLAIICGGIFCIVTTIIGLFIFYYYFWGYLREFIGYSNLSDNDSILTQQNAKDYLEKYPIYAGEIHYARIPVQYWQHRIQMVKSMGLNALSVYMFWNYHQTAKGKFDYQTENKNITRFLQLAKKYQMRVLLRPGPYVCAQWDFGGLPARLMSIKELQIRSTNKLFLQQTEIYFKSFQQYIQPFLQTPKNPTGPVILVQIQNQPGFYVKNRQYITQLKSQWQSIYTQSCPLYFDDTYQFLMKQATQLYWDNAIIGINTQVYNKKSFKQLTMNRINKNSMAVLSGEVYTGWFVNWNQKQYDNSHSISYKHNFQNQFQDLLSQKKSFSMYMAHGGTNFGLTAGYGMITSYDYFAPINEQGSPTDKYHIFRSLYMNYMNTTLPSIPSQIPSMQITLGFMKPSSSLFSTLSSPLSFSNLPGASKQQPFLFQSNELKMFNQGLVLYETFLNGVQGEQFKFSLTIHDVGIVYLDGHLISTIQRPINQRLQQQNQLTLNCSKQRCKLQILVQAMGHINFGPQMAQDKKGILKFKRIFDENIKFDEQQTQIKFEWNYYLFNLKENQSPKWSRQNKCEISPCLYEVEAELKEIQDVYLEFDGFKKGYIWINDKLLGRYWNTAGPQNRIYCPGVWLKKGRNKIVVLDLFLQNQTVLVKGEKTLHQNE